MEAVNDRLSQAWSPVLHLNSTMNSPELRDAYQACLEKLSAFGTWVGQHEGLFKGWQALKEGSAWHDLSTAQRRTVDNALRDFRLAGVDLPADKKARYGDIQARLSTLSNQFSNHVLDATQAWHKDITDPTLLAGVPESALETLKALAEAKGAEGYRITLDFPSFFPIVSYADNRELREEVYTAFVTRASNQGPKAGQFDNAPILEETLALRQELARLLGFDTYADYSLVTKMADSPTQVLDFLEDRPSVPSRKPSRSLPSSAPTPVMSSGSTRCSHGMSPMPVKSCAWLAMTSPRSSYAPTFPPPCGQRAVSGHRAPLQRAGSGRCQRSQLP